MERCIEEPGGPRRTLHPPRPCVAGAALAGNSFGHAPATTPLLWMPMPGGASTGLKCHIAATDKCRIGRLKQRVKAHCAGEIVRRSPTRWLGADTFDSHCSIPLCPPASAAYSFERRRQAAARPFLVLSRTARRAGSSGRLPGDSRRPLSRLGAISEGESRSYSNHQL